MQPNERGGESMRLSRDWSRVVPELWSGLLFPGQPVSPGRPRAISLLILLLLPGMLIYPCLSFRLFEPDEGRYAEIPREMLGRGEWVVPLLQGEPYLDKPPLLYWLVSASYRVFGTHDWSARLVPAVALHACILGAYVIGLRSLGERAAFCGAVLLTVAPGFTGMGRLLILDGLLAFWVSVSLLAGYEAVGGPRWRPGWWVLSAAACGLAVLTKGPIGVVLVTPPLVLIQWLNRPREYSVGVSARHWLLYVGIVGLITAPWYLLVWHRVPKFLVYFLWEHNVVRFVEGFDHIRPVWFYGPVLFFGLMPGALLAWPAARFLTSAGEEDRSRRGPGLGFMLLAGGWCLVFFSVSSCKLPTYILPAFPPLALALGSVATARRWDRPAVAVPIIGGAVVLLATAHLVVIPWYARFHSPMGRPDVVAACCADPRTPIVCYPRTCDSVGFYLERSDLVSFRSKETNRLVQFVQVHPRAVVVCTHRHSLETLRAALPPALTIRQEIPLFGSAQTLLGGVPLALPWETAPTPAAQKSSSLGLCYLAVIEHR